MTMQYAIKYVCERYLWSWKGTTISWNRRNKRSSNRFSSIFRQQRAESRGHTINHFTFFAINPILHLNLQQLNSNFKVQISKFKCMIEETGRKWKRKWEVITNCISWLHEALLSTAFAATNNERMRIAAGGKGGEYENHGIVEFGYGEMVERENDLTWW